MAEKETHTHGIVYKNRVWFTTYMIVRTKKKKYNTVYTRTCENLCVCDVTWHVSIFKISVSMRSVFETRCTWWKYDGPRWKTGGMEFVRTKWSDCWTFWLHVRTTFLKPKNFKISGVRLGHSMRKKKRSGKRYSIYRMVSTTSLFFIFFNER